MTLLNQPLIQFLLLGTLIFAVDRFVVGSESDPRRILIDDEKYAEIAGIYRDNQGRDPSEKDMSELVVTWAQNEVLYREARLMELDEGDEMIRQRLILKLRNVLFNRLVSQPPTEEELRAWFEVNRPRYDTPAAYDFEQFKVGGPDERDKAVELASGIGASGPDARWQNDIRVYEKRPAANLELIFGKEYTAQLIASPDDRWIPVTSPAGWHLARITARFPERRADFDVMRSRVGEDWKAEASQAELAEALQGIAGRYDIRVELSAPPAAWDEKRIEETRLSMESPE